MRLYMTKNRELLTTIALVVVALLIGAGIGHSFTKRPSPTVKAVPDPAAASVATRPKAVEAQPGPAQAEADDEPKRPAGTNKSLADILKNPNAAQRNRELEEFVKRLAPSEI